MIRVVGRGAPATVFALLSAMLIIAHQVGGKATRDAIFLSQYHVTELPKMLIVAALSSMLAVVVMSRLLASFGPWRIVPAAFMLSAVLFVANWSLYARDPALTALTLYLQTAVFGAVLISGFWSVVNERFDPHTAKRSIARVAAAATLGGVLGGVLADRVAALADARAMLAVLGALHAMAACSVLAIGRPRGQLTRDVAAGSGLQILFQHSYLLLMGTLMVLVAALAALVDYAFKAEATRLITDRDALVGFFGRFYAVVGLLTFLVQSLLGPRMLNRFGLGATLAVLPAMVLIAGLMNAFLVRLWAVVALRAGQMVFQNSFFRSSFELLYTPVPPARKRPTKSIIDVASDRLGDVLGGGIILGLLAVAPQVPAGVVILAAMLLAVLTLLVVRRLYAGYVAQLADNLRDGAISLHEDDVVDATTRQTLAELSAASERTLLQARIRALKERRGQATVPWVPRHPDTIAPPTGPGAALAAAAFELTSGDRRRVRACLEGEFMDPRLAPFIVPMLAVEEVADLARTELRWLAPRCLGALGDALLDPDIPLLARQRLPSVLEVSHDPRSVQVLLAGIEDAAFNVRYSSARALYRMLGRDPELAIDATVVYAACAREVDVSTAQWNARDIQFDHDLHGDDYPAAGDGGQQGVYSLDHVFTLLSLVLDRDALKLSLRAVFSSDRAIRGTALEYLENVLPDDIRRGLWPHLGVTARPTPGSRSRDALVAELERARRPGT